MDAKVKKAVKESVMDWIQTVDNEDVLYILHDIKERNREITPEEKQQYNRWLAALDYKPQLDLLRAVIASSPDRDAIWNALSPEAQENLRTGKEVKNMPKEQLPKRFWDLVRDLKKGEELSKEPLSEAEKEALKRADEDIKAGRTIPHEEVMKEVNQWLDDMTLKQVKEDIPDLPEEMRAEIADFVLETLNRSK